MKKKYLWLLLFVVLVIVLFITFNMKKETVKEKNKNKDNEQLTLLTISYSVDSTSGKVDRSSMFINDNLYILTTEKTNENNVLDVKEYAVSQKKWNEFVKVLNKYKFSKMNLKKKNKIDGDIENINIVYDNNGEKIEYNISSNMKLSWKEKKIFKEVSKYLEKLEDDKNSISSENRDNY